MHELFCGLKISPNWSNCITIPFLKQHHTAKMASESHNHNKLHFLLVPFLSLGHLIPMVDIARLLAQHGAVVTIVTTPINATRITPMIDLANNESSSNSQINLVQLQIPVLEFGLPEGCESVELIPSRGLIRNFNIALSKLQEPIEELIEELKPTPTCLLVDKFLYWMEDVATKFQIPRLIFDGTGCINLLMLHNLLKSNVHETVAESQPFVVPNMPHRIELTKAKLPVDLKPDTQDFKDLQVKLRASAESAYGVVVNSFEELELDYVKAYSKAKEGKTKVWCIGPVSLSYKGAQDIVQRGNKAIVDQDFCMKWLDSWPPRSVVYVCLGSILRLALAEFQEFALALEECNCPFILVMREDDGTTEAKKWLLEDGFEERTKGRGLIIHGWAPQVLMLSHQAMGVFLTHCGWNSTLEAICAGVPMVTWPTFADQFFNEKLVVQILGIGEALVNEVTVPIGKQDQHGTRIKREQIVEAIYKVIGEGSEKEEMRERARKLAELAKKSMEPGGSSCLNMKMLIEDMEKLAFGESAQ